MFAFESKAWDQLKMVQRNLTHVFRQSDSVLVGMLNNMRFGRVDPKAEAFFQGLARTPQVEANLLTHLYCTRNEVESHNVKCLDQLEGPVTTFNSIDWSEYKDFKMDDYCLAPKQLKVKVGAVVMLIKNLSTTLVNGTIGKVEACGDNFVHVRFYNHGTNILRSDTMLISKEIWEVQNAARKVVASRSQIPLILSYAL